jgi:hypothetical protein
LRAAGYRGRVVAGDGREGFADQAPYDRILATASSNSLPIAWFEQLKADGLLHAPLQVSATGVQVIPLFRKTGNGFRSTAVIGGGFMPLRGAGESTAMFVPPALRSSEVIAGSTTPICELYGQSLATLSARAKRRLLSIVLEDGRRRPLGLRGDSRALSLFVALRLPARSSVSTMPKFGVGVITRDGTSLAVLEFDGRSRVVDSFRVYGSERAAAPLLRAVREWDRRVRPTEGDLVISVGNDDCGRPRVSWRRGRRGSR